MPTPFADIACASLPLDALPHLAALRCEPGLQVATADGRLWLRFEPGSERVLRCVLPLPGVELFACRDGTWRRFGQSLPAFDFPHNADYQPLAHVLFPSPVLPMPMRDTSIAAVQLTLKPDDRPRPTTALRCPLAALAAWADTVPTACLHRLHGVARAGQVLVVGAALPVLNGGERFWGKLVLVPLGFRPEPDLPEAALREAASVQTEELLLLGHAGAEAVPRAAFGRLSRAALRLAAEGTS
jgi:hypothetical protein